MTRIRQRPAGFDARPERPSSLRAQAQRLFLKAAERDEVLRAAAGEGRPTALTQEVRALYEAAVVPVAEIARLAGVNARTIYKYARKGSWRRRRPAQDLASAVTKRAEKRRPRPCVTRKGAGGRFIRSADAGRPYARGLKALDPAGEARALARCRRAASLAADAARRTARLREALSDARTMALLVQMLRDLTALEDLAKPKPATPTAQRSDDAHRREIARRIEALVRGDLPGRRLQGG
jgi:hypothetical protein